MTSSYFILLSFSSQNFHWNSGNPVLMKANQGKFSFFKELPPRINDETETEIFFDISKIK